MKKALLLTLSVLFITSGGALAKNAGQYKKEIAKTSKNLEELQKSIKEKRLEKEKCLLDEKCIGVELNRIDKELKRLEKKGQALVRDRKKAEKMLSQSEKGLKLAGWEKKQWLDAINGELNLWYREHRGYYRIFDDKVSERLRYQAMTQKKTYFDNAKNKESLSRQAILKWRLAQTELKELKNRQEKNLREHEGVRQQKKDILKTTVGRRLAADAEIKKLTESSKALEQLIIKLEKAKKKTEQESLEKKKFKEKKKRLPWPIQGEVVMKFGRNKHPEFDTYVISNGIRIKAAKNSDVKTVSKGEVIFCGEFRSYGLMVIVDHGGGFYTIYGLLSELLVKEDEKLQEGGIIGRLGGVQPQILYFEVRSGNQPENPELWLR